jgi:hypothetical protein
MINSLARFIYQKEYNNEMVTVTVVEICATVIFL